MNEPIPSDIDGLAAMLAAEREARREAEARANGAEAMVAHLKALIARMRHDRFGASSERGRKLLDQMELQLEELEAAAARIPRCPRPMADQRCTPSPAASRSGRRCPNICRVSAW